MTAIDDLQADLDAARADLLAALEGVPQDEFVHPPPIAHEDFERLSARDLLWQDGLLEDWTRRVIVQALEGRLIDPYRPRPRPAIAEAPPYLLEWLSQTRRPLASLLARIGDGDLDRVFTLQTGEPASVRGVLGRFTKHERALAQHVRRLRASARGEA